VKPCFLLRKALEGVLVAFLASVIIVSGCAMEEQKQDGKPGKIKVVTTIFPLADIVCRVGGEKVEVKCLLSAGDSPHTFEPTPGQARDVARAELLFYIGGGLDDWVLGLAGEEEAVEIEVMEHLKGEQLLDYEHLHLERDREKQSYKKSHDHNHCHGPRDPHVWLDPIKVKEIISPLVKENLSRVSPEKEDYFNNNLEEFQRKLAELDEEIKETATGFTRSGFISYHSAWNYYAERYGLEEVAAVEEFPGDEPSGMWLRELVQLSEEYDIEVIFAEPQLRKQNAEIIAEEIDGEVLILDPLGGEKVPGRDGYLELMRYNTELFEKALE